MASIVDDGNGLKRVLFVAATGKRKAIRLGKMPMKKAEGVCRYIEDLVRVSRGLGGMEDDTAKWLTTLNEVLLNRLAKVDLVVPAVSSATNSAYNPAME